MTLTLELTAREQAVLEAKAAQMGVPVERYAMGVLQHDVEADDTITGTPRQRASGFGKFAHLNLSSADVRRDRCEEVAREEARFKARLQAAKGSA